MVRFKVLFMTDYELIELLHQPLKKYPLHFLAASLHVQVLEMLLHSGEIDQSCQTVLRRSYGGYLCVFPDVMSLNTGSPTAYCIAHDRQCKKMKRNPYATADCILLEGVATDKKNAVIFLCLTS